MPADAYGEYESLCEVSVPTKGALVEILPAWQGYVYLRRTIESFFKYTPPELNPICIIPDDASPGFRRQNWDYFYEGVPGGFALPRERICHRRFAKNRGLTRGWNAGLSLAREMEATYAVAGNSDILHTPDWEKALLRSIQQGAHLVGPVTNAPGWTTYEKQNVARYFPGYKVSDDKEHLHKVAKHLRTTYDNIFHQSMINGFFMLSTVEQWWRGAFDVKHVFNPRNKMQGNEDELEIRWKQKRYKVGFCPGSFVFHYRAVSRGDKYRRGGWLRADDPHKPI